MAHGELEYGVMSSSHISCVRTIQDALNSLAPSPTHVDVSIVTQTVTVRHPIILSADQIKATLDSAGFDIVSTPLDETHHSLSDSFSRLTPLILPKRRKHIEQCTLCLSGHVPEAHPSPMAHRDKVGQASVSGDLHVDSEALIASVPAGLENPRPTSQLVLGTALNAYKISLSIGGMTCASCSNTITDILNNLPGVTEVVINLIAHSGFVTVDSEDRVKLVVESIEDAGYEAEVVSLVPVCLPPVRRKGPRGQSEGSFRVTMFIGGMTCASCSNTVSNLVSDVPGVSEVAVNLIGKSGTATIVRRELADKLVTLIEEAGYEAEVIEVRSIDSADVNTAVEHMGPRTVSLRISGMTCS